MQVIFFLIFFFNQRKSHHKEQMHLILSVYSQRSEKHPCTQLQWNLNTCQNTPISRRRDFSLLVLYLLLCFRLKVLFNLFTKRYTFIKIFTCLRHLLLMQRWLLDCNATFHCILILKQ